MNFDCILGQKKLKEHIKKALENDQLLHAYLVEGQKGLGKKRIAYYLAKGICCRGEGKKPCGQCVSCKKIEHKSHPEVKYLEGDTTIKIEEIREIQKNLQVKPYEGNRKVYIIPNAEKMTLQAQNALLKTLEEPPEHASIILLTTNGSNLLPTIVSRCQRLKLLPVSIEEIQEYLIKEKGVGKEEAKVLASFSNGVIGRALQLLEDDGFKSLRREIIKLTRDIMEKSTIQLLERLDFFIQEKSHIDEILQLLIGWYRDLLVYKETRNKEYVINIDELEEIIYQSNRFSLNNIKEMIFIIDKAIENFRNNSNYQLNLEVMLLNLKDKAKF